MSWGACTVLWSTVGIGILGATGLAAAQLPQPAAASSASPVRSDAADAETQGLLLDGVRAFRAERYEDALQIFHRVRHQHLLQDIGFYEGMALHKLGRHAEALVAFRAAHRQGLREPIADYYQAVSCYRLGMMGRALRGFSALLPSTSPDATILGPRLQLGVQKFVRAIEQAGFRVSNTKGEGIVVEGPSPGQLTERLQAALANADATATRSAEESVEWLEEAAELLPGVGNIPTYRPRFRELLLRVRSAAGPSGSAALAGSSAQTAVELNLLWCRIADSRDCAL